MFEIIWFYQELYIFQSKRMIGQWLWFCFYLYRFQVWKGRKKVQSDVDTLSEQDYVVCTFFCWFISYFALPAQTSFCLSVFLSFCLSVFLSFCLSVFLSFCQEAFCLLKSKSTFCANNKWIAGWYLSRSLNKKLGQSPLAVKKICKFGLLPRVDRCPGETE